MIYTVTFNPSLDYVVHMKTFTAGDINRAEQEIIYPGGKGINVSLVLGNLHIPSKMLGFVAGFTGREIERLAKINGGDTDFVLRLEFSTLHARNAGMRAERLGDDLQPVVVKHLGERRRVAQAVVADRLHVVVERLVGTHVVQTRVALAQDVAEPAGGGQFAHRVNERRRIAGEVVDGVGYGHRHGGDWMKRSGYSGSR